MLGAIKGHSIGVPFNRSIYDKRSRIISNGKFCCTVIRFKGAVNEQNRSFVGHRDGAPKNAKTLLT